MRSDISAARGGVCVNRRLGIGVADGEVRGWTTLSRFVECVSMDSWRWGRSCGSYEVSGLDWTLGRREVLSSTVKWIVFGSDVECEEKRRSSWSSR